MKIEPNQKSITLNLTENQKSEIEWLLQHSYDQNKITIQLEGNIAILTIKRSKNNDLYQLFTDAPKLISLSGFHYILYIYEFYKDEGITSVNFSNPKLHHFMKENGVQNPTFATIHRNIRYLIDRSEILYPGFIEKMIEDNLHTKISNPLDINVGVFFSFIFKILTEDCDKINAQN